MMLAKLPAERAALLEAADLIEEYGHAKGVLGKRGEPMCALGAIDAAVGRENDLAYTADTVLRRYLKTANIVGWNNVPERTKEEVVDALRDAALHGL